MQTLFFPSHFKYPLRFGYVSARFYIFFFVFRIEVKIHRFPFSTFTQLRNEFENLNILAVRWIVLHVVDGRKKKLNWIEKSMHELLRGKWNQNMISMVEMELEEEKCIFENWKRKKKKKIPTTQYIDHQMELKTEGYTTRTHEK